MGLITFQTHQLSVAARFVEQAIANGGETANYLNTLGVILKSAKRYEDAAACLKRAIDLCPQRPESYNHLGLVFLKTESLPQARSCFKKAIDLDDTFIEAHYNLGIVFKKSGCLNQAVACFEKAVELRPNHARAYNNAGGVHLIQGNVDEAMACFRKAIRYQPDFASARMNLAMVLLLTGKMGEGWTQYEWRLKVDGAQKVYPFHFSAMRWDGMGFKDKTLLVHDEQGFGDTIQFVRYLPMVKALGGKVLFETRAPLIPLLKNAAGIDSIVERSTAGRAEKDFDFYVPLLSLPFVFNTTSRSIPQKMPYLFADSARIERWRHRIQGHGFRVGISWAGSSTHHRDAERSLPPSVLKRLLSIKGIDFYGLQKQMQLDRDHLIIESAAVDCLDDDLMNFADTAAAIGYMDLVISVDTAVAHLAGAMGKRVWCMLPYSPDWRWGLKAFHSPWYPSMRLFRQPEPGDWASVLAHVCDEISMLLADASAGMSNC
ncbi:tetratricopeptide repeat protein [Desulfosarcina ovata]|nr:tetratricopeptide repeat-containing glycosyltransferase family protein [Desulfosarcina ovata]